MGKVKLGDIAVLINGDRGKNYPSQKEIITSGGIPFVNAGHLNGRAIEFEAMNYITPEKYEKLNSGKFQQNDILYCLRGSLGKKALINDIRPNLEKVRPQYLMLALETPLIKEQLFKFNNGSSQPNLSAKSVKEYKLELPDLFIQDSIISKLEKVRNLIEDEKQEKLLLDNLIQARFVYNDKKWETDTVKNLCKEIYGGGTPSKAHPEYYKDGDIPWVSAKDMKTDVLKDSQIKINQLGVDNSTARLVPVNSVIMVIRSGILKHTLPVAVNKVPITVNQDLKVFIPGERILTRFLAVQFKMQEKDILSGVRAVTADNIEFNSLKQRRMIVPPIDLQQKYLMFLERIDKSKFVIHKFLYCTTHNTKSIIKPRPNTKESGKIRGRETTCRRILTF